MRYVLLLGIGQTGSTTAELFMKRLNKNGVWAKALAIDTDETVLSHMAFAEVVSLTDERTLSSVVEDLGEETVKAYFPCDWEADNSYFVKALDMRRGANLWRNKAFLSLAAFLDKKKEVERLHSALDELIAACGENSEIEIYAVASLAGGTGSALFLPITLYVKKYLKQAGGKVALSSAYLTMPDIYSSCLTDEQKVKCNANAYAALRELNAINRAAFAHEGSSESGDTPIAFRIAIPEVVTLFDAEEAEYRVPDAAPFDKVMLFERVPTVNSVSAHIELLVDALVSSLNGEPILNPTKTDALVGSVSLVKLTYPVDCVVKYITKEQLRAFVSDEIALVGIGAEAFLDRRKKIAKNEKRVVKDTVGTYRECYLSTAETMLEQNGDAVEALIHRDCEVGSAHGPNPNLYDVSWLSELDRAIEESVLCEPLASLKNLIKENESASHPEKRRKGLAIRREKKQDVSPLIPAIQKKLADAYRSGGVMLRENSDAFEDRLLSRGDGEFSITNDILGENGAFLHPIYALFKLCVAHKKLTDIGCGGANLFDDFNESARFPRSLLRVEPVKGRSRYSRYGALRLERLLRMDNYGEEKTENTEKAERAAVSIDDGPVADDPTLFFQDLNGVCDSLFTELKKYRYRTVIEVLERLIARYRSLIATLCDCRENLAADAKLALVTGSTSNAVSINVGASLREKQSLCAEYVKEYGADSQGVLANDLRIAEAVSSLVLSGRGNTVERADVIALLEEVERIYGEHIRQTEFYRQNIDKDVLRALNDSVECGVAGISYASVFSARYIPLRTGRYGTHGEHKAVQCAARMVVSDGITVTMHTKDGQGREVSPSEFVKSVVAGSANETMSVKLAENLSDKEAYLYRETLGYKLHFVEALNELSADAVCYASYRRAIRGMKKHGTRMWDPMLTYNRNKTKPLPFISPTKQRQYDTTVVKAVLFALLNNEIFVEDTEGHGRVYGIRCDFGDKPICVEDSTVSEGDFDLLFRWASQEEEWSEENSAKYDAFVADGRRFIPSDTVFVNGDRVAEELGRAVTAKLSDVFFAVLLNGEREGTLAVTGYTAVASRVVNETLSGYFTETEPVMDERRALLYNRVLSAFFERATERMGKEKIAEYAKMLNAKGMFLHDSCYNRFCELAREEN